MRTFGKILVWIVIANVLMIPLIWLLGKSGWLAEESGSATESPSSVAKVAPDEEIVDLSDPIALETYQKETDVMVARLDRQMPHIYYEGVLHFYRRAEGSDCLIVLATQTKDQRETRLTEVPATALASFELIASRDHPAVPYRLRVGFDTSDLPPELQLPVMVTRRDVEHGEDTIKMISTLELPMRARAEGERVAEALIQISSRCKKVVDVEA